MEAVGCWRTGRGDPVLLGGCIRLAKNAHNNIIVLCWAIVVDIVVQLLSFVVVFIINIIVLEQ